MSTEFLPAGTVYTYARVSDDDRRTGSCSLQWQQDQIKGWLLAHDRISGENHVDNGVSASVPLDQRMAGRVLVAEAIQQGDVIVVAKMDRMFRDVVDFRERLRAWAQAGVALVSCSEGLDLTTPTGRMICTMIVAVAEWERETIQGRIVAAIATRKAHGLRASAEPPYGWQHVPFGPTRANGSQECRVKANGDEQVVIAQIEKMRAATLSLREIAAVLNRTRAPARRAREWGHSTVQGILEKIEEHRGPLPKDYLSDMSWSAVNAAIAAKRGPRS
jgi:site-specific DNA recombinase